ncbi:hypothetical protein Tco_0994283 [Tanacetum coccineum]
MADSTCIYLLNTADSRYIYLSKMADSTCIYLLNTADSRYIYLSKMADSTSIYLLNTADSRYIYLSKMADSTCIYLLNTADSRMMTELEHLRGGDMALHDSFCCTDRNDEWLSGAPSNSVGPLRVRLREGSSFLSFPVLKRLTETVIIPVRTAFLELALAWSSLLRSLKQEQERATVTFGAIWRPVLALESWAGHVDAQGAEMWQAKYDDYWLIHDLLV